jgi:hypothetical protein
MPHQITRRARQGEKPEASHINEIIDYINSLRPLDSATVKHSWTSQGVLSHSAPQQTATGNDVSPYAFLVEKKSPIEKAANTVYVSYVAGDVYASPWDRYRKPEREEGEEGEPYGYLGIDATTNETTWYVAIKYDYGLADLEGTWGDVSIIDADTLAGEEWSETVEGEWKRRTFIIAEVTLGSANEDGKRSIKTIVQRWTLGDIWFNDIMRCKVAE